jgi:hypothetical protein
MLIQDFGARAQECIAMAERARSERDRRLLIEMARAWCGVTDETLEEDIDGTRKGLGRRMSMARRYSRRH